jgi:hypothetical protein
VKIILNNHRCWVCNRLLIKNNPEKKFCSDKCRHTFIRKNAKPEARICKYCGELFVILSNRRTRACGSCRPKKHNDKIGSTISGFRYCLYCDNVFFPLIDSQFFCNDYCRVFNNYEQNPNRHLKLAKCPYCERIFVSNNEHHKFCDTSCQKAYYRLLFVPEKTGC